MSLPVNCSLSPWASVPEKSTTPWASFRLTSIQQSPETAATLTRFFCHAGTPVGLADGLGDALAVGDGLVMPSASGLVWGSSLLPQSMPRA